MICTKCGKEMQCGYGLAGGGIGPYFYCESVGCEDQPVQKFQDPEMESPNHGHPNTPISGSSE